MAKQMRWREAILTVLGDSSEPMHYADIAQAIIDNGYRTSVGPRLLRLWRQTSRSLR